MTPEPTLEWLLGDTPDPSADIRAEFTDIAPPPALVEATLQAVARARREDGAEVVQFVPRRRWYAGAVTFAAMAAAALFSLSPAPEVGNPDRMVPRGLEDTMSPEIHMKMAVEANGALERHRRGTHYREGDRFFFRYQVAAPGWVHLVRADTAGLSVLKSVEVSAGEDDLRHDGELLSWTTDATDGAAVFGLLATPTPVPDLGRQLTDALATFPETDATLVCSAAMREGWTCDAVDVEVLP